MCTFLFSTGRKAFGFKAATASPGVHARLGLHTHSGRLPRPLIVYQTRNGGHIEGPKDSLNKMGSWWRPAVCDGAQTLVRLPLRGTADRSHIYKQSWRHMMKDRLKRKLCFFPFVWQSRSAWINHYARMHLQISVPCIHMLHMSASEWVCVFLLIGDSAALHAAKVILLQYANGVLFTREICIQRLQEGLWVCKLLWGLCCLCQGRWCITENRTRQPERDNLCRVEEIFRN